MVNSKKLLSLFLAVVMIFSTLSVMSSAAYTIGSDVADGLNFKYTVEKVDTVPETAAGSAEYTADNIYAVTLWAKASMGLDTINTALHFDKTLFSPIMLFDGEVTYPHGAGFGVDDYYTNMEDSTVYAYTEGDYMNHTAMYKANGTVATTKALAKCIGNGNANSAGRKILTQLISPDHSLYGEWGKGLPENAGVIQIYVSVATNTKTAYLNTIEGINYSTDWNRMQTVYFESIADDVTGAEFGIYTPDCFTVDGNFDGTGSGYFVSNTDYEALKPASFNISGNAVVEGAPAAPEVVALDDTMARMDDWTKAESTNTFDGGLIGQINNLKLTFTEENGRMQCNEIDTIEVYANGNKMGQAYQVYKVDDTTYQFRAVILNMDKTAETYSTDVEYEFKVTLKGEYADYEPLTATKTVSAETIFTEAYNAYKAANA